MIYKILLPATLLMGVALSACNDSGSAASSTPGASVGASAPSAPTSTPPASAPARTYAVDAMIYDGDGVWGTEVTNIEALLDQNHVTYHAVSSAELGAMTVDQMANYGVFIVPGGSGGTEAGSVSAATHANLREAVQKRGLNYIGFCAGAFVAVAPAPKAGGDVSYGFGIVDGPELNYAFYENQGQDLTMSLESFPDGTTKDLLYYGGPVTPNVAGGVIAKYSDGTPAISEMFSGNGFVVLSGVHPTATASTLSGLGLSSTDGAHTDFAFQLINAALHQQKLPAF
ncbi:MAG: BPL-N domain-containing protein [Bdellovibrionota bacterium]